MANGERRFQESRFAVEPISFVKSMTFQKKRLIGRLDEEKFGFRCEFKDLRENFTLGKLLSSSRIWRIPFGRLSIKSKQFVLSAKSIRFQANFSFAYSSWKRLKVFASFFLDQNETNLFQFENVSIEMRLKRLVGVINTKLFETIRREIFETENI